jgi:Contractile injection system tube protein
MADQLPAAGKLEKLTIKAYGKAERTSADLIGEFVALFNPGQYSTKVEIEYGKNQGQGTSGASQPFGSIKPQDYTFELIFDGTGAATPEKRDVHADVQAFLDLTAKLQGPTHRPPFLLLGWGPLQLKVILKAADISYTLFKPSGEPLRAKVAASFSEALPDDLREKKDGKQSPDLTHERIVRDGDTLPLLTHGIYGTPLQAVRIAAVNGLDHLRDLQPGARLRFPPLARGADTRKGEPPPPPGRG